jgi:hypothetical protein
LGIPQGRFVVSVDRLEKVGMDMLQGCFVVDKAGLLRASPHALQYSAPYGGSIKGAILVQILDEGTQTILCQRHNNGVPIGLSKIHNQSTIERYRAHNDRFLKRWFSLDQ